MSQGCCLKHFPEIEQMIGLRYLVSNRIFMVSIISFFQQINTKKVEFVFEWNALILIYVLICLID
jgi:hypothetical protein